MITNLEESKGVSFAGAVGFAAVCVLFFSNMYTYHIYYVYKAHKQKNIHARI